MKRISALGDSILKGIVLDRPTDTDPGPRYTVLAERFSERCRRALDLVIDNYGRFGNTVTRGLRDLERHREGIAASDFVVLEYGGNDCDFHWEEIGAAPAGQHAPRTPLDRFAATYRDLIGRIRQAAAATYSTGSAARSNGSATGTSSTTSPSSSSPAPAASR